MHTHGALNLLRFISLAAVAVCLCGSGCSPALSPLARALGFLQAQQTKADVSASGAVDYAGDWPQFFSLDAASPVRVRDASPFIAAFIHHALTNLDETNAAPLGLSPSDIAAARTMRRRAITFLHRFQATPADPAAGTFGFWPYDQRGQGSNAVEQCLALIALRGPILNGTRVPVNLGIYPHAMAIPPDADVTATTYAALLDDASLDGGPGAATSPAQFFADWRDTGEVPRRFNPPWLPHASGAFLTWLNYGSPSTQNDVDLVVNANVLHALGRYGLLDTPGVTEAVALINLATAQGLHRTHPGQISIYYPDNYVFHYAVSRAYHEGPVPALQPAVDVLAGDLEQSAIEDADGTAHWDKGAPHLNTAFAVLALMNAGRTTPLIGKAIAYLRARQNAFRGNWDEGLFFVGRTDSGVEFGWLSESFTTAMVLEALSRHALDR